MILQKAVVKDGLNKVKKKLKKIFHTKLRRKKLNKPYSQGQQIAW